MYHKVVLIGNLGRDPEMRYTQSGKAVTNLSLATSKTWTDKTGERQEKTVWFKVTAWDKLAEIASEHLAKGREVLVVGEMEEPNIWTDREGNPRSNLEVTARDIRFLGSKSDYEGVADPQPKTVANMVKPDAVTAAPRRPVPTGEGDIPF